MDRILLKNIFSLFSIQAVNYFLPLILIPYLVRVLGIENFGIYGLILAIIQYLIIIIDYGFNFTATKEISIYRGNKLYISKVFCSVIFCKIILSLLALFVIFLITIFYEEDKYLVLSFYFGFFLVIGSALFPVWLYQGYEKMIVIAISNFIARLIGILLVFILVKKANDTYIAILIQGIMSIIAATIALTMAFYLKLVTIVKFERKDIINHFKSGWDIFISTSFVSLYTTSIPIVLGATSGAASVGIYSAADKIKLALQGFIGPISQALYPRLSRLMSESKQEALSLIKQSFKYFVIPLFALSFFVFLFSDKIVYIIYGQGFSSTADILKIIIWIPPIIGIGNLLGVQIMLPMGLYKEFSRTYIFTGVIGFVLIYFLSKYYSYYGVSISLLLIEIMVVLLFFCFLKKASLGNK
ncbi:flippase [Xenorhabdus sp. SF857]|uniref:flippase n=1 Tax=Xenorhabdus bakwenae TaxID=3026967 RepID=UPI00255831C5|nr:flippase [Xenorhabdus sp. SF857]WFQ78870.1 flippase [Xenorhabdus sp. SF857]